MPPPRRYTSNFLPDEALSVNDTQSLTYDLPQVADAVNSTPDPSDSETDDVLTNLAMPRLLAQDASYGGPDGGMERDLSLTYADYGERVASPTGTDAEVDRRMSPHSGGGRSGPGGGQSTFNPDFFDAKELPTSLQAVLCDYGYWMDLVTRLGYDPVIYHGETPTLEILSRYFDSSSRGLLRVFHLFDKDHDQVLTFQEIARGLHQQGLFLNRDNEGGKMACLELCELIATRGTRDVRPPEFLWALKNLRLAALLASKDSESPAVSPGRGRGPSSTIVSESLNLCMHVLEYRADRLLTRSPLDSPVYFLFQPGLGASEGMDVRWVHLHDADRQAVLGLAVKYGLDPRYVLDVFYLWREQARCDKLNYFAPQLITGEVQVLFVIVPVLRLTERARESLQAFRMWKVDKEAGDQHKGKRRGKSADTGDFRKLPPTVIVEIEHCNLAFFVAGKQGNVVSFSSEWGILSKLVTDDISSGTGSFSRAKSSALYSSRGDEDEDEDLHPVHPDLRVFKKILVSLQTSYSVLRTGDSHTFLLKSLCEISDDYRQVNEAYVAGLYIFQKRLERKKNLMSMEDMRKIRKGSRQLSHLYRLVRPMVNVAEVFQNMKWGGDSPLYVSEIHTNVTGFLEGTLTNRSLCKQIMDDFHNFSESHLSSVVFALTIVFSVCAPGQFVASIYGMNFRDAQGPTIPELKLKRGYVFYWVISALLTILVGLYMYYKRKIGWTQ